MKVRQSEDDLNSHLREQIQFLLRSSQAYDEGFWSEAKRLAVVIRVLLHDTKDSHSLLSLLKSKDILFYDSAKDYDPENLVSTSGLIAMKHGPTGWKYVPKLDRGDIKITFEPWWNKIVFVDKMKNIMTRKDIVLAISNKDGGAHIDPRLNKDYAYLTRFKSLGWVQVRNGKEKEIEGRPELACVRQISYEIINSFRDEFPTHF